MCKHEPDDRRLPLQDVPISEVMAVCEASERMLRDIDVAEFLQLTDVQKDAIVQLRSEYMDRRAVNTSGVCEERDSAHSL